MGKFDRSRFRQIMVDAETYERLKRLKLSEIDSFREVISRLLTHVGEFEEEETIEVETKAAVEDDEEVRVKNVGIEQD